MEEEEYEEDSTLGLELSKEQKEWRLADYFSFLPLNDTNLLYLDLSRSAVTLL